MKNVRVIKKQRELQEVGEPLEKAGYVYIFNALGTCRFKIGKSVDPSSRLKSLQTGSPLKIRYVYAGFVEEMSDVELTIHSMFSGKRIIGEWFDLDSNDIKEIISIIQLEVVDRDAYFALKVAEEDISKPMKDIVLEFAKKKDVISVREVQRLSGIANRYCAEEIKELFYWLESKKLGVIEKDKNDSRRILFIPDQDKMPELIDSEDLCENLPEQDASTVLADNENLKNIGMSFVADKFLEYLERKGSMTRRQILSNWACVYNMNAVQLDELLTELESRDAIVQSSGFVFFGPNNLDSVALEMISYILKKGGAINRRDLAKNWACNRKISMQALDQLLSQLERQGRIDMDDKKDIVVN